MITLKKTAIAAAIAMSLGASAAQAFPIVDFAFDGNFTMRNAAGGVTGGNNISGTMQMDMATGAGTASVAPYAGQSFFGYTWTAHNITMQATGPGTVHANMLFDWGATANISVGVDFAMAPSGMGWGGGAYSITTMDSNGDGIPGIPMDNGPFPGFNAAFDGTATVSQVCMPEGCQTFTPIPAPVPAAAWLLGSGLLGLVGVARRKLAV